MTHYKYLIVGGGMAANAAVKGIRSVDARGAIGLITGETDLPYDRPPLTKGLWKHATSIEEIIHKLPEGVDFYADRYVESCSIAQKAVVDDQEQSYSYEKLLLVTGGTPKRLPFDRNSQILYYRTLSDYRQLHELSAKHKRFAVIGGGFIGSEIAAALTLNGNEVTLIFPENGLCAHTFPADVSGYLNRYYESQGVRIQANTRLTGILGERGQYRLQSADGDEIPAEVVVAGVGIVPNTELAEKAGLRVEDGIMVNGGLQTSAPDIYAAGDVANFEDKLLGERRRVEHEDNANSMGEAAGRAMAGAKITYRHSPMFYSDLFDLGYEAVGKVDGTMQTYIDWQDEYTKGVIYYLEKGRVRGVLLWNVWEQVEAARQLIAQAQQWRPEDLQGQLG